MISHTRPNLSPRLLVKRNQSPFQHLCIRVASDYVYHRISDGGATMDGAASDQSLYHVDDDLMINFMVGGIFSACTAERREKSACERARNHRRRRPSFISHHLTARIWMANRISKETSHICLHSFPSHFDLATKTSRGRETGSTFLLSINSTYEDLLRKNMIHCFTDTTSGFLTASPKGES